MKSSDATSSFAGVRCESLMITVVICELCSLLVCWCDVATRSAVPRLSRKEQSTSSAYSMDSKSRAYLQKLGACLSELLPQEIKVKEWILKSVIPMTGAKKCA